MIKIVFIDIEGTLTPGKFKPLDLFWLKKIQEKSIKLREKGILLTISTGRPQPYVESMLQAISGETWAVCENGALIYHAVQDISEYNEKIPKNFFSTKIQIEKVLHQKWHR